MDRAGGSNQPNILTLIGIVLEQPASSCECERGFSQVGLIMIDIMRKLSKSSLGGLVIVKEQGLKEFNPYQSLNIGTTKLNGQHI